jgi:hypothetical protein
MNPDNPNNNMIDVACWAFAIAAAIALCGCQPVQIGSQSGPAAQIGSSTRPAVTVELEPASVQIGPTSQPMVTVATPVSVNIPSMAIPAALFGGIFGGLVLVGIVLGVQRQHSLTCKRMKL